MPRNTNTATVVMTAPVGRERERHDPDPVHRPFGAQIEGVPHAMVTREQAEQHTQTAEAKRAATAQPAAHEYARPVLGVGAHAGNSVSCRGGGH